MYASGRHAARIGRQRPAQRIESARGPVDALIFHGRTYGHCLQEMQVDRFEHSEFTTISVVIGLRWQAVTEWDPYKSYRVSMNNDVLCNQICKQPLAGAWSTRTNQFVCSGYRSAGGSH